MGTCWSPLRQVAVPAGQADDGFEDSLLDVVSLVQDRSNLAKVRSGKEILKVVRDDPGRTSMNSGIRENGKLRVKTMGGGMGRGCVEQAVEESALNEFEKRLGGFDPTGAPSSCL
jgi:hypothetical protein